MTNDALPFWQTKSLAEMSRDEWESLCDGCGQCCMLKLEDDETGVMYNTRLACALLDIRSCRCSDYPRRHSIVPDCIQLTPQTVREIAWLPQSCAYRRIAEGRGLASWHPLVSGEPGSVHAAGVSVRSVAVSESHVPEHCQEDYVTEPVSTVPAVKIELS